MTTIFAQPNTFAQPKYGSFDDYKIIAGGSLLIAPIFDPKESDLATSILSQYDIADRSSVNNFLDKNRNLLSYLKIAPEKIQRYFSGKNLKLSLEIVYDPEVEPEYDHGTLFINILSKGTLTARMDKLDRLTREWLITIPPKEHLYFEVDLDFT
jgi:hypothetical protein